MVHSSDTVSTHLLAQPPGFTGGEFGVWMNFPFPWLEADSFILCLSTVLLCLAGCCSVFLLLCFCFPRLPGNREGYKKD